ncbi:hypothetical protein ACQKGO_09650 [Corallococcus interemptor]|uniref:hypothetical protein n=1 Tax=Corallococcus interemptor TaxID=2316720 RepID=UPI003CFBD532
MSEYSLEPPTSAELTQESHPLKITVDSPRWARDVVEVMARYLKKERRYDSVPFDAAERSWDDGFYPYEAYVFHEVAYDLIEDEDAPAPSRAIGAVCLRNIGTTDAPRWTMQWAWFHPFARGRGKLSDFWPTLKATYGNFTVEKPLSSTMKAFLAKHNQPQPD